MRNGLGVQFVLALGGTLVAGIPDAGAGSVQSSGWQSGEQISRLCATGPAENPVAVTFCLGYLQGALDAFLIGRASCVPAGTDANGLRAAVLAHAKRHPDRVQGRGPVFVYDAFRTMWPACAHMPGPSR
ncbi:Rap1a/Tai family immunity protein [Stappia stellulata]|uniref:Rap1a/Tai family immunity protein n=1 Tax=Stappia stellulata TaxID=71235 RepID=UPI00048E4D4D|nr:Rap1a/Tai family immunity protein [Stappia stellulata]